MIRWLLKKLGREAGLPPPCRSTLERPWRYHATHWTPHHGRGARS